jgi:hypothetical protein
MGTPALVSIFDDDGDALVNVYHQYDGDPNWVGKELARILDAYSITDGLGLTAESRAQKVCNGPGCLAATYIREVKQEPGGVYIVPTGGEWFAQFFYEVRFSARTELAVKVFAKKDEVLFEGSSADYVQWVIEKFGKWPDAAPQPAQGFTPSAW